MKKVLLTSLFLANSAFAINCDYPAQVLYHCTSENLEVCISESTREDVLFRIEAIQPRQSMSFERKANVKNNRKKLSIKYSDKLFLITIRSVKFDLNKRTMKAIFKVRDFNLGIGDGPHWDASVPKTELTCTDVRNI